MQPLVGTEPRRKVLVVEDEPELRELLAVILEQAGFTVLAAKDPPSAFELFEREQPDAGLLDLNLGPWDGLALLRELRERGDLPLLVLTARGGEDDKVLAMDMGADDYIVKPFGVRELVARIRAHVRRARSARNAAASGIETLTVGPLSINVDEHSVEKDGERVHLTVVEFRLLQHLMRRAGQVVRTGLLAREVWGYEDAAAREVVRVTLHRLRRKLGEDASNPRLLQTVPGVGVFMPKS